MKVIIVGAGAAGCFCAINLKRMSPQLDVHIYDGGEHPLAKVAITGGGRCNLTNSFRDIKNLADAYPRGANYIKRAFKTFDYIAVRKWFQDAGVKLVIQKDQCVFPASQDAMEIVFALRRLMRETGVKLHLKQKASLLRACPEGGYDVSWVDSKNFADEHCDYLVVTTGGSPKAEGLSFLAPLELEMVAPVPSLFTFTIPSDKITELSGAVVENACTNICGTSFKASGPLLITHWGMSGPAILKLSSHAARYLAENDYKSDLSVNWLGKTNEQQAYDMLQQIAAENPKKMISGCRPDVVTGRLWEYLVAKAGIRADLRWAEAGNKSLHKLAAVLINDIYHIKGQSRFKEEFVTCGGVALSNVSISTLECRTHPGLYFAGEVLDIDAITGGFNLQAAWSTAYITAKSISESCLQTSD